MEKQSTTRVVSNETKISTGGYAWLLAVQDLRGRDLDAAIVREIYNWRYIPVSSDANGENSCQVLFRPNREPDQKDYNQLPRIGAPHEGWFAPNYATDLRTAIELAIKVGLPLTISEAFNRGVHAEILSQRCLEHFRQMNGK